jgi:hypothetical protein
MAVVKNKMTWALNDQAKKGVIEAISNHTIVLGLPTKNNFPDHGTGVLVEFSERRFVVTCKHVVKPSYRNKDLKFIPKEFGKLEFLNREKLQKTPLSTMRRSYVRGLPIIKRFYSDDEDDLVLLELDATAREIEQCVFHKIPDSHHRTPPATTQVFTFGFSDELVKEISNSHKFYTLPSYSIRKIVEKDIESSDFNKNKHFLVDYTTTEETISPLGFSGCGVWTHAKCGEGKLWIPNLYLAGVQTGIFKESQVLKATRIERLLELFKSPE